MAIVKCSAVHSTPMAAIKYVLNPKKNRNGELVKQWNCSTEADEIYDLFKQIFEYYSHERFEISEVEREGDSSRKSRIRIHHYIQSFAAGEVTPEEANEIGYSLGRQAFGSDKMFVVSTHIDTDHIHNHILLCPYTMSGKIIYQNKATLKKCREVSDRICSNRGLSVIKNPKKHSTVSYAEYIARKKGTSWKAKMCSVIDSAVCDMSVNSLDDFIEYLQRQGYDITRRKYLTIKAPNAKHGIRSFRLGDGYSLEAILYRIENKDRILTLADLENYKGFSYELAVCVRQLQRIIYRQETGEKYAADAEYADLIRSSELLKYVRDNNITSEDDLRSLLERYNTSYLNYKDELDNTSNYLDLCECARTDGSKFLAIKRNEMKYPQDKDEHEKIRRYWGYIRSEEDIDWLCGSVPEVRDEVKELSDKTAQFKQKRDEAEKHYNYFLEFMENDYKLLLEHHKLELEEQKRREEDARRERERKQAEELRRQEQSRTVYRRSSSWER